AVFLFSAGAGSGRDFFVFARIALTFPLYRIKIYVDNYEKLWVCFSPAAGAMSLRQILCLLLSTL
ncbi:MAG: hypothetical protein J6V07_06870, partial [Clostridia bacterium]|nr:hypothetical protein [Clostridia bacterium]